MGTDRPTDQPTDQRTDGQSVARDCRLLIKENENYDSFQMSNFSLNIFLVIQLRVFTAT